MEKLRKDEIFLVVRDMNLHDLYNFSLINKYIYFNILKFWNYFLHRDFPSHSNLKEELESKEKYKLLFTLTKLKKYIDNIYNFEIGNITKIGDIYSLYHLREFKYFVPFPFPKDFSILKNLQLLDLTNYKDEDIKFLNLRVYTNFLNSNLRLKEGNEIPIEIFNLTNLESLWLEDFPFIPEETYNMKLKFLGIQRSNLVELKNLKNNYLEHLYLSFNKLFKYVGNSNFPNLKKISFSYNILEIVENLYLPNLEDLYLCDNRIKNIKNCIFPKLYNLLLDNNMLDQIPENINKFTNLIALSLSKNNINKCENIDNLLNLKELYLLENNIENIETFNLPNLEILEF